MYGGNYNANRGEPGDSRDVSLRREQERRECGYACGVHPSAGGTLHVGRAALPWSWCRDDETRESLDRMHPCDW